MTIEFIGMIHHREASKIRPPANSANQVGA